MFGNPVATRDLRVTTPHGEASLNIYHPSMQAALVERASSTGGEVKRGAKVVSVDAGPGRLPRTIVTLEPGQTITFWQMRHSGRRRDWGSRRHGAGRQPILEEATTAQNGFCRSTFSCRHNRP